MKTLCLYYTRTNTTKAAMEHLAKLPYLMWENQFNLFDSHDVSRLHNNPAVHPEEYRGAVIFQFMLTGAASIYYGDEAGTDGGEDPFNRGCYPWGKEDDELIEHYRFLGRLRKEHSVFKDGEFVPVSDALGCVAYERRNGSEAIMTVANRNNHSIVYVLPEEGYASLTGETVRGRELYLEKETAAILVRNYG